MTMRLHRKPQPFVCATCIALTPRPPSRNVSWRSRNVPQAGPGRPRLSRQTFWKLNFFTSLHSFH